jgi:hypothetical protein
MHHRFDWLDRFEDTTEVPATGPVQLGEIAVKDLATGETLRGAECFRLLCRNIPAYWPVLLLLHLPAFRRAIEREIGGCEGDACELPGTEGVTASNARTTRVRFRVVRR